MLPERCWTASNRASLKGSKSRAAALVGSSLLRLMENAKRLLIEILSKQEISVGPLAIMAGLSQSVLSWHLGKLRSINLVQTRRDTQTVFDRSDSGEVRHVL